MSSDPPQQLVNQQLEQALLGGLLRNPTAIEHLGDFLPDSYAFEWHATIHRCLAESPGGGLVALQKTLGLNDPELRAYIAKLPEAAIVVRSTDLRDYARHVTDLYRRRDLVRIADQLRQDALTPDAELITQVAVTRALDGLDRLSVSGTGSSSSHSLDDALQTAMQGRR